ncbi:MAG: hypothetical protein U0930_14585 [Pirellulales bacterium]
MTIKCLSKYLVCLVIGLVSCMGCSQKDGRVAFTGTVYVDSQPTEGVTVAFINSGETIMATAVSGSGGKFTCRAGEGRNFVAVSKESRPSGPAPSSNPEDQTMGTDEQVKANQKNMPKALLPEKLADPKKSGLFYEIKEGVNLEIKVNSK